MFSLVFVYAIFLRAIGELVRQPETLQLLLKKPYFSPEKHFLTIMQDLKIRILQSCLLLVPFYTTRIPPRNYKVITGYSLKICLYDLSPFSNGYFRSNRYFVSFTKPSVTFNNIFTKSIRPIRLMENI